MAQLILSLTKDGLICEAPGLNGARNKISGITLHDLPPEMIANLLDQRDRENLRQAREDEITRRENARRHKRIFATSLERYPHLGKLIAPEMYLTKGEKKKIAAETAQQEAMKDLLKI